MNWNTLYTKADAAYTKHEDACKYGEDCSVLYAMLQEIDWCNSEIENERAFPTIVGDFSEMTACAARIDTLITTKCSTLW